MYAIIQTGGKQYRVAPGDVVSVERLGKAEGAHVFEDVLLVSRGGDDVTVGAPTVKGARVEGTILGERKAKKVLVFRYKKRKNYKKLRGHRQIHARVRIDSISG